MRHGKPHFARPCKLCDLWHPVTYWHLLTPADLCSLATCEEGLLGTFQIFSMRLLRDYLIVQPGVALGMQGGACSESWQQFWEVSKGSTLMLLLAPFDETNMAEFLFLWDFLLFELYSIWSYGDGSTPISINFNGMNIHLPAVLWFTRYHGYDPSPFDQFMSSFHWSTLCLDRWPKKSFDHPMASQDDFPWMHCLWGEPSEAGMACRWAVGIRWKVSKREGWKMYRKNLTDILSLWFMKCTLMIIDVE